MTRHAPRPGASPPPSARARPARGLPADLWFHCVRADEHGRHRVCALVSDTVYGCREIGLIVWDRMGGEIQYVHTAHDVRRRGVATALWLEAKNYARREGLTSPRHSAHQTRDGEAWASTLPQ